VLLTIQTSVRQSKIQTAINTLVEAVGAILFDEDDDERKKVASTCRGIRTTEETCNFPLQSLAKRGTNKSADLGFDTFCLTSRAPVPQTQVTDIACMLASINVG
jgi:hypothetical protein